MNGIRTCDPPAHIPLATDEVATKVFVIESNPPHTEYENNATLGWLISPTLPQSQTVHTISINFTRFDTEENADFLFIYQVLPDGTEQLQKTFSGSKLPEPVLVKGGVARVVFTSNENTTGDGFSLHWRACK